MRGRGWVKRGIQSLDVLYSGNFQCCCDYIEKIALKESKNEAEGTTKAVGRKRDIYIYIYIEQESARDLRSLMPLSPTPFVLDAHKNVEI